MFASADTLFAVTCVKCVGPGVMGSIQGGITWLKPAPKGCEMTLTSTVLRSSKTILYCTVDFSVNDELVAQTTLIFGRKVPAKM